MAAAAAEGMDVGRAHSGTPGTPAWVRRQQAARLHPAAGAGLVQSLPALWPGPLLACDSPVSCRRAPSASPGFAISDLRTWVLWELRADHVWGSLVVCRQGYSLIGAVCVCIHPACSLGDFMLKDLSCFVHVCKMYVVQHPFSALQSICVIFSL